MSHTIERPSTTMVDTPMDTRVVYGRPGFATAVESDTEWHTIAHLRNFAHDDTLCELCTAFSRTQEHRQRAIRAEANAHTATMRRIRADIATAEIARDLIEAEARLDSIISG